MDFKTDRPIFRQIVDLCHARILQGIWQPGGKVPSVRELAVELTVNTHTVLKAFDMLQGEGVIMSRRGLGFFLADDAGARVLEARRREFYDTTLRDVFDEMATLRIGIDDIVARYKARGK